MLFTFKRKQFSDVVKVVEFLDKSGIEYEVTADISIAVGDQVPAVEPSAPGAEAKMEPTVQRVPAVNSDPLWRVARHDDIICDNFECKAVAHYGAEPVGA